MALFGASLDRPSNERKAWLESQAGEDKELLDYALRLLEKDSEPAAYQMTGGVRQHLEGPAPDHIGAYKITGILGEGGMGVVYAGERDKGDFAHRVAIKVIRAHLVSDELKVRFDAERDILARLSHPGIARLFDGGEMDNGAPYLVMEYVDGTPIKDWADKYKFDAEARLELFQQTLAAIGHAHQNLIVHRDITPSNILVTSEGRVKVIDFGIARPHREVKESGGIEPPSGSLSFTPGYAAPERYTGNVTGIASDIYSLGKLLKDLLGGLKNDAELAAIIACATALQPEDRYPSIDMFLADTRAYLGHYPVSAFKSSRGYRFGKFFKRHPVGTFGAGAGMLGLVGALAAMTMLYQRANTAREATETRFAKAREVNAVLLFDVYDDFAVIPGTLEARRKLADTLYGFTNELAGDPFAPDDILLDVGVHTTRLADLYGGIGLPNLGETKKAETLYGEAVVALETLIARAPDNGEAYKQMLTAKRYWISQIGSATPEQSQLSYMLSDELLEQSKAGAEKQWPEARAIRRIFWQARTDRVRLLLVEGKADEALESAVAWRAELTPEVQANIDRGESMAAFFAAREGEIRARNGDSEGAIPALLEAASFYGGQLQADKADPSKKQASYYLTYTTMLLDNELASAYIKIGNGQEALKHARLTVKRARQLVARDPVNAGASEHLSRTLSNLARAQYMVGEPVSGRASFEEALSVLEPLIVRTPDNEALLDARLWVRAHLARAQADTGNIETGCKGALGIRVEMEALEQRGALQPFTASRILKLLEPIYTDPACGKKSVGTP